MASTGPGEPHTPFPLGVAPRGHPPRGHRGSPPGPPDAAGWTATGTPRAHPAPRDTTRGRPRPPPRTFKGRPKHYSSGEHQARPRRGARPGPTPLSQATRARRASPRGRPKAGPGPATGAHAGNPPLHAQGGGCPLPPSTRRAFSPSTHTGRAPAAAAHRDARNGNNTAARPRAPEAQPGALQGHREGPGEAHSRATAARGPLPAAERDRAHINRAKDRPSEGRPLGQRARSAPLPNSQHQPSKAGREARGPRAERGERSRSPGTSVPRLARLRPGPGRAQHHRIDRLGHTTPQRPTRQGPDQ